ncbi:MAG: Uma2 family endonuclease [Candidatus Electrothrix sp. AUS4]|nr:Uma2 family endonuclease [Candidatus Electrothrix sp. AUS4]
MFIGYEENEAAASQGIRDCGSVVPFLTKAPSLIFEILSPSTSSKDRITKFNLYEEEGVDYYCIVDPKTGTAKVHVLRDGRYVKLLDATDETVTFTLKDCVFEFDFSRIWG